MLAIIIITLKFQGGVLVTPEIGSISAFLWVDKSVNFPFCLS